MVAALVFLGLGYVSWLVWEFYKAPVTDDNDIKSEKENK